MRLITQNDCAEVVCKALRTPPLKGVFTDTMSLAIAMMQDVPTIEAEPIVRCGECKWANSRGECTYNGKEAEDIKMCYCSYGERKDEVKHG